jgi:hypothetical protein
VRMLPARFRAASCDRKLSPVDLVDVGMERRRPVPRAPYCCTTYASIHATCVDDCPFKRGGCYVDAGFTKFAGALLDQAVLDKTAAQVAAIEARLIDEAFPQRLKRTSSGMRAVGGVPQDGARGGRDLRLHVGGDAADEESARLLAGAAQRWRARGGGSVWTYTHSWRRVTRAAWGASISVLASVESAADARLAIARGYAPAIVVPEFPLGRRAFEVEGLKFIPCPAETGKRTCVDCRLCLDRPLVQLGAGIAFKAHGNDAERVLAALRRKAA